MPQRLLPWVYSLPTARLTSLLVLFLALLSIGGLLIVRAMFKTGRAKHGNNDLLIYFFSAVSLFYGVMLGLVTVSVWTNFADAQKTVNAEALDSWVLFRSAETLSPQVRAAVQSDIILFIDTNIEVEWPKQQSGEAVDGFSPTLEKIQNELQSTQCDSCPNRAPDEEALRHFYTLVAAHNARIELNELGLPPAMWSLLALGTCMSLSMTWFFRTRDLLQHLVLTVMLAGLLGANLSLVIALDNPLRGDVSITSRSFERIRLQMRELLYMEASTTARQLNSVPHSPEEM